MLPLHTHNLLPDVSSISSDYTMSVPICHLRKNARLVIHGADMWLFNMQEDFLLKQSGFQSNTAKPNRNPYSIEIIDHNSRKSGVLKGRVKMQYVIAFLEGIITFISPCLLPMLPIYISYFAGGGERSVRKTLSGALGFVTGFSIIFVILGALAGTVGSFLRSHQTAVNIVSGLIVIFFGLNFLGVFHINLFKGSRRNVIKEDMNFFSALVFGVIFSLGWTPCVGAFLGSALMLASQQGHVLKGMLMLLAYSLGLGIPFILSAVLIDYLKSAFNWIKRNYKVINIVSGCLLVLIGVMMASGTLGRLLSLLS